MSLFEDLILFINVQRGRRSSPTRRVGHLAETISVTSTKLVTLDTFK